jgi:hypothetical protein
MGIYFITQSTLKRSTEARRAQTTKRMKGIKARKEPLGN